MAQDPENGSYMRCPFDIPAMLHKENAASGSSGVVVTQIRLFGAIEKSCTVYRDTWVSFKSLESER